MALPRPGLSLSTSRSYSQVSAGVRQYIDVLQIGTALGAFNQATGQIDLSITLRIRDSIGTSVDVATTFTTEEISGVNKQGVPVCIIGFPATLPTARGRGGIPPPANFKWGRLHQYARRRQDSSWRIVSRSSSRSRGTWESRHDRRWNHRPVG